LRGTRAGIAEPVRHVARHPRRPTRIERSAKPCRARRPSPRDSCASIRCAAGALKHHILQPAGPPPNTLRVRPQPIGHSDRRLLRYLDETRVFSARCRRASACMLPR
jgi:hypothetical protein